MQENGFSICNDYIRLKNPLKYADNSFIGSVNEYNFNYQIKNFDKLKLTLEPFRIYPDKIFVGHTELGDSFVVETNSPVVWYKRATRPTSCSANNFLYLGKHKMKLSSWLQLNDEQRSELINIMNQQT